MSDPVSESVSEGFAFHYYRLEGVTRRCLGKEILRLDCAVHNDNKKH